MFFKLVYREALFEGKTINKLRHFLQQGWFVDDLLRNKFSINIYRLLYRIFNIGEYVIIEKYGLTLVTRSVIGMSRLYRHLHTGNLMHYISIMIIGVIGVVMGLYILYRN